jgi:hypothetical protein
MIKSGQEVAAKAQRDGAADALIQQGLFMASLPR